MGVQELSIIIIAVMLAVVVSLLWHLIRLHVRITRLERESDEVDTLVVLFATAGRRLLVLGRKTLVGAAAGSLCDPDAFQARLEEFRAREAELNSLQEAAGFGESTFG